jgi:N-acetylmuramoyl-L-alanine amidase
MLAAVARRSVPILVVALALFAALLAPVGASAFAGLAPALRELAARPTPTDRVARPLAGKVVGIDPGHNGGNFSDPSFINSPVWNGREEEACDTTGTETDGGYTEALFNFRVASYLRRDLIAEGAKVVMTRRTNTGVGPCITRRAKILNKTRADVAIDIHADGGPAEGRGVAILTPVADGPNDHVIASSKRFGRILLKRFTLLTGIPISNYDGSRGFAPRDNLAGLNLTTVPKVLIECVNMRNATDASRLVKPSFQRLAAKSMAEAITGFLATR